MQKEIEVRVDVLVKKNSSVAKQKKTLITVIKVSSFYISHDPLEPNLFLYL
jgi:hypothetical protein